MCPGRPRGVISTKGDTVPEDLFRAQLGEPHHYAYVVDDIEARGWLEQLRPLDI